MPHACAPNNELLSLIAKVTLFGTRGIGPRRFGTAIPELVPNWLETAGLRLGASVKSLEMCNRDAPVAGKFGHSTCIWPCVGRVPTRSAPTGTWGGRGPLIGRNGSFPPASEREARMDDPMGLQSPTAGPKERDLWGSRSQARAPSFFLSPSSCFRSEGRSAASRFLLL
jgi:hypothetical protein